MRRHTTRLPPSCRSRRGRSHGNAAAPPPPRHKGAPGPGGRCGAPGTAAPRGGRTTLVLRPPCGSGLPQGRGHREERRRDKALRLEQREGWLQHAAFPSRSLRNPAENSPAAGSSNRRRPPAVTVTRSKILQVKGQHPASLADGAGVLTLGTNAYSGGRLAHTRLGDLTAPHGTAAAQGGLCEEGTYLSCGRTPRCQRCEHGSARPRNTVSKEKPLQRLLEGYRCFKTWVFFSFSFVSYLLREVYNETAVLSLGKR